MRAYKLRNKQERSGKIKQVYAILLNKLELVIPAKRMKVPLMKTSLEIFCINWNRILLDQGY